MYCGVIFFVFIFFCGTAFADGESISEYRIGVGDVIQISVWQYEQFNSTTTVGPDGKITTPFLGDIVAAGFTRKELKEDVTKRLSKFIKEEAEVTVSIVQFNSQKISIFGRVANQRTISFSSIPSLLEVIVHAVPAPDADLTAVKIISSDPSVRKPITVNMMEVIQSGDISKLPRLYSGDTVYVPRVEVAPRETTEPGTPRETTVSPGVTATPPTPERYIINVMGAVSSQGSFEFTEEPTFTQALMRAGSVTNSAALRDVRVIRGAQAIGAMVVHVDLEKYLAEGDNALLPRLSSGDTIYVPVPTQEEVRDRSVIITGEVLKPGSIEILEPTDILDIVSLAGGLTPNADPERIRVRRESADLYQDKIVNISESLRSAGSSTSPEMVGPGYRIYVPSKQRNPATATALVTRGIVAFIADLIPIYGLYRLIIR